MYEELGSVKEPVDLSPSEALVSAEALLRRQGYRVIHRTKVAVVGQREITSRLLSRGRVHLAVFARPHPDGGLCITLRGDDLEGVRDRQSEWSRWAEGLPKFETREKKEREQVTETPHVEAAEPWPTPAESAAAANTEIRPPSPGEERRVGPHPPISLGPELRAERPSDSGRAKKEDSSGAWASVSPWERKVRIAPGKSDLSQKEPTEGAGS